MESANYPDRYCVRQGKTTTGVIVCLPHQVVVSLTREGEGYGTIAQ